MALPADVRIDQLHELLGEQEKQREALNIRIHDLERIQVDHAKVIERLVWLLDGARGRTAVMETVIPLLLESSDQRTRDRVQTALELRWLQDQAQGAGATPATRRSSRKQLSKLPRKPRFLGSTVADTCKRLVKALLGSGDFLREASPIRHLAQRSGADASKDGLVPLLGRGCLRCGLLVQPVADPHSRVEVVR